MMALSRMVDLVLFKAYADMRSESQRTYLGFLWWLIEPVVNMIIYYVVFGLFLRRGEGVDFAFFLLVGMMTFRWFQGAVRLGGVSLIANAGLMRLVYLPKAVFPSIAILTVTAKFLVAFAILVIVLAAFGFPIGLTYLGLPVVLLVELLVIVAATYLIAAVLPFVPDLWVAIDNGLTMLFFLSGIFFAGSSLPERYQTYFYLNPMAHIIESYRVILLEGEWPAPLPLLSIALGALLFIGVGAALLGRFDRLYPRSIR